VLAFAGRESVDWNANWNAGSAACASGPKVRRAKPSPTAAEQPLEFRRGNLKDDPVAIGRALVRQVLALGRLSDVFKDWVGNGRGFE
jgi:hypothetical protein